VHGTYDGDVEASLARGTPTPSPDGHWLAFSQATDRTENHTEIWVEDTNTKLVTRLSSPATGLAYLPVWSADSREVRWVQQDSAGANRRDIWIMNANGTDPRPFLQTPYYERRAAVSPPGKWIAYQSNENGLAQVWVQRFPKGGARSLASDGDGTFPVWASDDELVYMSRDLAILTQLEETGDRVRVVSQHQVAELIYHHLGASGPWSSSPGTASRSSWSWGTQALPGSWCRRTGCSTWGGPAAGASERAPG